MAYRLVLLSMLVLVCASTRAGALNDQLQALLKHEWARGSSWLFNGGPLSLTDGDVFPVITRMMQPKVLMTDRALDYRPLKSVCVVGDDDLSAEWLETNREYLTAASAICIVANVASQQRLIALQKISPVALWPMSADQLSQALGLSHYPVLIDAKVGRIRQ